jgi:translation initiation factor IF-1
MYNRDEGNYLMIDANYVVGLSDGEGCFYVVLTERDAKKHPRAHVHAKSHFYIKLREDDKIILEEIKRFFGYGFIYFQKENRKNHSPCYRFEVNSNGDKVKLIDFFQKHPLHSPKKKRDFEIFAQITKMIINREHFRLEGKEKIRQLKASMHH